MPDSPVVPDPFAEMRELSHERVYRLWQAAKHGGTFQGDDAQQVQAMCDHPEYYEIWDHANEFGQEPMTVDGVNPLMHVTMHVVVENQAALGQPPEVRAVLAYRASQHLPRHDAVHAIANELARGLWHALHDRAPFDNDAYRARLAKLLPPAHRTTRPSRH